MTYHPLNRIYRHLKQLHVSVEKVDRHGTMGPHLLVPEKRRGGTAQHEAYTLIFLMKDSPHLQEVPTEWTKVKQTERARLYLERITRSVHPRLAPHIDLNKEGQFIIHLGRK